jgi:putative oxidoreductase
MGFGGLLVRGTIGAFFVGHGTQKLFGWFGGGGPEGTGRHFASSGLRPGRRNAVAAGAAEAGGGLLLVLGLATPAAAAALSGVMITAIRQVHLKNGPWASNNGYEYAAVMLAAVFGVVDAGPGRLSLDAALGRSRYGLAWAMAALAAGAAGSYAVTEAARREEASTGDFEAGPTPREQETVVETG